MIEIEIDFKLFKRENKMICFPQKHSLILTSNKPQWELSGPSPKQRIQKSNDNYVQTTQREKQRVEWDKDIDPRHKNWIPVRERVAEEKPNWNNAGK